MDYWDYYDEGFSWDDSQERIRPDYALSVAKLVEIGFASEVAQEYVDSGYVYERRSDSIIDRHYGGLLMPTDGRTRWRLREFSEFDSTPLSHVSIHHAHSWDEVRTAVATLASRSPKGLLFRGQTQNYEVLRRVHNPHFLTTGVGEVSLIPSLWRRMLSVRARSFLSFCNLSLFEWSFILYSGFDMPDIERRHEALLADGEWVYTMSQMAECSDPVLREFGEHRLDVAMGLEFNLATPLATLLQHYGLYSNVLDLTRSLDVAIFFATHKLRRVAHSWTYEYTGSNAQRAVLYVLREDAGEMRDFPGAERVLKRLVPLRPKRQECVVSMSAPYALNLPAAFLLGVIVLAFDADEDRKSPDTHFLFPGDTQDVFLRALKTSPMVGRHLTEFA